MNDPFADLVPQNTAPAMSNGGGDPFGDLIPAQNALFGNAANTLPSNVSGEGNRGFLNNLGRHALANIGTFGKSLVNIPHNIYSGIPAAVPTNFNYYNAMGVTPGLTDQLAEGGLEVAPYLTGVGEAAKGAQLGIKALSKSEPALANLFQKGATALGKAPNLSKQVAAGALYGGVNASPDNKAEGTLAGAGLGALGVGLGKAGDLAGRKIAQTYVQSAVPGLLDKAAASIRNYITPKQSADLLQSNYTQAAAKNAANWANVDALADPLDKQLAQSGRSFDASPFQKTIKDFLDKSNALEPAKQAPLKNAMGFAAEINKQAPQSFGGVVSLRQNLNQELKRYLDNQNIKTADAQTRNLIPKLKDSLNETIDANKGNVDPDLLSQFSSTWNNANASHSALQDFVKTPNPQGTLKPRVPRREALNAGSLEPGALNQYIKPSLRSMTGINQLNKLTGNEQSAPSYVMRNLIEGKGNQNPLTPYEALSPVQRQSLFGNTPEGENLNAAHQARLAFGNPPQASNLRAVGHHIAGMGGVGLGTFLGAETLGDQDWKTSMGLGLAAALGEKGLEKLASNYATPASTLRAIKFAKGSAKRPGRYLSPVLAGMFSPKGNQ